MNQLLVMLFCADSVWDYIGRTFNNIIVVFVLLIMIVDCVYSRLNVVVS